MSIRVSGGRLALPSLKIPLGIVDITLDFSWCLAVPAVMGAIVAIYIPIAGAGLYGLKAWITALIILLCIFASLAIHVLAHAFTARFLGCDISLAIPIHLLGDIAQGWPPAPRARKEALVSITGVLAQGLIAAAAYLIWNAQVNQIVNTISFFLILFNLGLAVLNLTPAFPFDGGRLARSVLWRLLDIPDLATRMMIHMGFFISLALLGWSAFLVYQQTSLSLETGAATFIVSISILYSLVAYRRQNVNQTRPQSPYRVKDAIVRISFSALIIVLLLAVTAGLIPMNYGLEAPGFTASVEPMVKVAQEYRHSSKGTFIISSVILQAPILAAEWAYGHLDTSLKLVPQEKIIPVSTSVQAVARGDYQMLLDSETTAVVVGLRQAGYPVEVSGKGARIIWVRPQSPADGALQVGDAITGINGVPVTSYSDLKSYLGLLKQIESLRLQIERRGQAMEVDIVPDTVPQWNGPACMGINVTDNGFSLKMPFPVDIVAQKTDGGPSAGLMFTLGIFDAVTPGDLTGGKVIGGTGTVDIDGSVGPVGGIPQKVVAAERAGAQYFLCPSWNYQEALTYAKHMLVVKVNTVQEAIDFLSRLAALS